MNRSGDAETANEILRTGYPGLVVDSLTEISTSGFNSLWEASLSGIPHVLKRSRNEPSTKWIEFANDALGELVGRGLATKFRRNAAGQFVAAAAGDTWTLSLKSKGTPLTPPVTIGTEFAVEFLARLSEVECWGAALNHKRGDIWDWGKRPFALREDVIELACESDADFKRCVVLDEIAECWHRQGVLLEDLPRVLSHGEFQTQNVLVWHEGRTPEFEVVDWDSLALRPRLYDVASALIFFSRKGRGVFQLDSDVVASMLRAFALSHTELKLLPLTAAAVLLPRRYIQEQFASHQPGSLRWYVPWALQGAQGAYLDLKRILGSE